MFNNSISTKKTAPTSMDDRDGYIWYDGKLLDWRKVTTHVLTHALHYAGAVFEGMRCYNGQVFKLTEHNERLLYSGKLLKLIIPYSVAELNAATAQVIAVNKLSNCYVRPIAFRGSEVMGLKPSANPAHVAIAIWEWPSYFDMATKMKGISLKIAEWKRPAAETAPVHSKCSGLYMICSLAKADAEDNGYDDALFLDYRGYVAEATGANIFFKMKDGKVHTPIADCSLDGITRRAVIGLLKQQGYEIVERHISLAELEHATESFLTGTAAEVTPIARIGEFQFKPSDFSKKLLEQFNQMVGA